jgi:hypothetical protein
MPLTADQRAMLQLLVLREQSYADIASLLGTDEPGVRLRARQALTELGGADPDRNAALTDYLLGQADPIGRADVARHLRQHAGDRELAATIAQALTMVAPGARLPRLPGGPARRPPTGSLLDRLSELWARLRPAAPAEAEGADEALTLSRRQNAILVGIGSAAILLLFVILGLAGAFGGDDDSGTTADEGVAQIGEDIAQIPLSAAGGGDATGEATIGLASADTPYLDLTIRNLEPAPRGRSYFFWYMLGENEGYPFTPIQVPRSGTFEDRFAIPSEYIPVVQRATALDIWLSPNRKLGRNIQSAIQDVSFVRVPGSLVLHGPIQQAGEGEG